MHWTHKTITIVTATLLLASAHSQTTTPPEIRQIQRRVLAESLRHGDFGPVTPAQIDQVEAGDAIPAFETLFPLAKDPQQKALIAQKLVELNDPQPTYWDFLVQLATPAFSIDIPEFQVNDSAGPFPTPAMRDWAAEHNIADLDNRLATYSQQLSDFDYLATSGDARALPILRKALQSPNRELRDDAAVSLARLHDDASNPALIDLLHRVSANEQHFLAQLMRGYEDPAVVAAAKAVLPPDPDPLEQLRKGDVSPYNIEQIVAAHEVEAIPILKSTFAQTQDDELKDKLASALIRFHDPDPAYWNFLYERARAVIESAAPNPLAPDGSLSPEYLTWAKAHNAPTTPEAILYHVAGPVLELAETADPRYIPLLREGLHATHPVVPVISLQGLATVHAPGIIEYVVDEGTRNPAVGVALAMQLIELDDDPAAEQAAAKFLSPEMLAEVKKERTARPKL